MVIEETVGSRTIKRYDNVDEFMAQLRKSNPTWWSDSSSKCEWIFRGVANYPHWKLVPTAWREPFLKIPTAVNLSYAEKSAHIFKYSHLQHNAEVQVLKQYAHWADELGFVVDKKAVDVIREIHSRGDSSFEYPFIRAITESRIAASAQHYGLPTRLLDWSENPLVAIFFALRRGQEAGKHPQMQDLSNEICVWALYQPYFTQTVLFGPESPNARQILHGHHLEILYPERADNPYLRAQEGLFTLSRLVLGAPCGKAEDLLEKIPLIYSLEDLFEAETTQQPGLIGHVIDAKHCDELLELLRREKISEMYLMPDLRNVAKHLNAIRARN